MNYKLEGSGDTYLFIHGLSDSILYWEFLASNLKKDYQILRVDLQGHDDSELSEDNVTIDTYVNDIYELLIELDIKNVHLIGFSLGGAVALEFTLKYPAIVDSLVLMSTFSHADNHLNHVLNKFKEGLMEGFEEFFDLILPMVLCPAVVENNKKELEMLKEIYSRTANTKAYIKAINACLNFDVDESLANIDVPTLILAGSHDEVTTLKSQKDMQNKIKDSKIIIFDKTKHNLLVGKNNEKILNILKQDSILL